MVPLTSEELEQQAATKLLEEEEARRKARKRTKGRIRELEELRSELAEKVGGKPGDVTGGRMQAAGSGARRLSAASAPLPTSRPPSHRSWCCLRRSRSCWRGSRQ